MTRQFITFIVNVLQRVQNNKSNKLYFHHVLILFFTHTLGVSFTKIVHLT